jgi:BTB/POZ domain
VEDTRSRVHGHFLFTYSSVFRDIFRQQPSSGNIGDSDDERAKKENVIYLDGVSVLEFDSLLTFFYER